MGEVFAGRYELLEPIAAGGMGDVWTALDHRRNEVVAVKLLRQSDAHGLLRFMREQATRVDHPHCLTPLGWAGMDDRVLFSMPLVEGGSVATLVGDYGPLPARFAAELLRQLLSALAAVHAAGLVHRDVKPQNLLLDATGTGVPRLRLSDFGVALPVDAPRLTTASVVVGTPGYVAPEQALGAEPDASQDLYATGLVGFEMLSGCRAVRRGVRVPVERPADVDPALWDLCERLTDADPERRPDLAQCLALLEQPRYAWRPQDEIDVFRVVGPDADRAAFGASAARAGAPLPTMPRGAHPAPLPALPYATSPATPAPVTFAGPMLATPPPPLAQALPLAQGYPQPPAVLGEGDVPQRPPEQRMPLLPIALMTVGLVLAMVAVLVISAALRG